MVSKRQLRGTAFASIASQPKGAVSGWPGFWREVAVTQPAGTNNSLKQVAVTVYWNTVDGEISTGITSLVTSVVNN